MSKIKVVIVNGQGCAGKTTWEEQVKEIAAEQGKIVKIYSTIATVKELAIFLGWDGTKSKENRKFLSDLKDALTKWRDLPYQDTINVIKKEERNGTDLIFIDCRESKEIRRFVHDFNALTILVKRGNYSPIGNHADDNVLNYNYDIVIENNDGLEELREKAIEFVKLIQEDSV